MKIGPWKRVRMEYGDTHWRRAEFEIRPTGSTAAGKNVYWGVWQNGEPMRSPASEKFKRPAMDRQWDSVRGAKRFVDNILIDRVLKGAR